MSSIMPLTTICLFVFAVHGLGFILTSITWSRLEFTDRNIRCMGIKLPCLYKEVVRNCGYTD